jgi:sulfofructose kinase
MARVLCVGSAVIDFVFQVDGLPSAPGKYRAGHAQIVGGGCAANAAVAVARLGGEAYLAGRMGDDEVGTMILEGLEAEGVDTRLVSRTPGGRSAFSSVFVDADGERQIMSFRGEGLSDDTALIENAPALDAVLADTRWPTGSRAALALARARGLPGVLDGEDPIDADLPPLASHVAYSEPGLRSLGVDDPGAVAAGGWACVTDGPAGVLIAGGTRVPAFPVTAVDTLGAGDVWHGAFALRLAEGADETEAVRFACAAAALKCTRFGGRAGTPTRAETEALLERTQT